MYVLLDMCYLVTLSSIFSAICAETRPSYPAVMARQQEIKQNIRKVFSHRALLYIMYSTLIDK